MSIEEDIEYLQQFIGIKKEYKYKPIKTKTLINTRQAIENVLAELERLQKENKDLKIKENSRLVGTMAEVKLKEILKKDYISKDKIREKINYIKSNYSQINGNYFMMQNTIDTLQELLESEE